MMQTETDRYILHLLKTGGDRIEITENDKRSAAQFAAPDRMRCSPPGFIRKSGRWN